MTDESENAPSKESTFFSLRRNQVFAAVGGVIVLAAAATLLVVMLSGSDDTEVRPKPSESDESPPASENDVMPDGVEVVEQGHAFYDHPDGERADLGLGVVLENHNDDPISLMVLYTAFDDDGDILELTPERGETVSIPGFVALASGQRLGTGDMFAIEPEIVDEIAEIEISAEPWQGGIREVHTSDGEFDVVDVTRESDNEVWDHVTVDIDSTYTDSVTHPGYGIVYRDPEGAIVGGWMGQLIETEPPGEQPDGTEVTIEPGESTHTFAARVPDGIEASDLEVYLWP